MLTKRYLSLVWMGLPLHGTILSDRNMELLNNKQTHLEIGGGESGGGVWKSKDNMAPHKLLSARERGAFSTKMVK